MGRRTLSDSVKKLSSFWAGLNGLMLAIAGIMLFVLAALTVLNVALRAPPGGRGLTGSVEYSAMMIVAMVFLTMAVTQRRKAHVCTDIYVGKLAPRWQHAFAALGWLSGIFFFAIVMVKGGQDAWAAYTHNQVMMGVANSYTWPAKSTVAIGSGMIILQLLFDFIREIRELVGHKPYTSPDIHPGDIS